MEEEQGSHQAEEIVSTETQTDVETVTTQAEAPTGHKIKYNGVDEVVSYDEAPTWIQKGKNYDKVQEKATQLETQVKYLERRAKQEGFADVPTYLKAIDDYEQQQNNELEAQRLGIDSDIYAQHLQPLSRENEDLRNEVKTYKQQEQEKQERERNSQSWGELYKTYPHLAEESKAFDEGKIAPFLTDQMQQLVNQGYQPLHAYELAHKETLSKQKEQEIIARLTGRDAKQVLSSVDSPNNLAFDPNNMTNAQIDDISRRVRQGERITF